MLSDGIYSLLTGSAEIVAQLSTSGRAAGTDKTSGVFDGQVPQDAGLPFIVVKQISGQNPRSFDGSNQLGSARMEFSCYARTARQCRQLAHALKDVLLGFSGGLADGTLIEDVGLVSQLDAFEDAPFNYRCAVDLEIWFLDAGNYT